MRLTPCMLVAALAAVGATPAVADEPAPAAPRLTVPAKRFVVSAALEISLSKDAAFSPISLAPDIWYGVDRALTVGLVHSSRAVGGFLGGAGDSLCVNGDDGRGGSRCPGFYDRVGLLARYHLLGRGPLTVAADGGLVFRSFDPFALSLKLGAAARWQRGKLAVDVVPNLFVGLSDRSHGNRELLNVPVSVTYAVTPRIAAAGQLGMTAPLQDFRREVVIATSVGAQLLVKDLLVDVAFSLPHWLDTNIKTYGLDARTFTVGASRAF